jgi:hypothetical protein
MTAVGRTTTRLIETLGEIAALLESDGETQWRSWALRAKQTLLRGDYAGIEHVLGVYAGMGSLNDLVLGYKFENGVSARKPDAEQLNDRFNALRTRAWELAQEIKQHGTLI